VTLARRLLAGSLIVVAVLVAAIVLIAGGRLRDRLVEEKRDELARVGRVVALQWQPGTDAEQLAHRAGDALGYRVTLIDSAGVVVGDAEFGPEARRRLENHFNRPEIVEARSRGLGASRRHSASAGDDELYVAQRHPLGYVRVSLTTRSLDEIVRGAQRDVLVSGLLALLGALALASLFARSISQPVVELRDVARAIASGDLHLRPALSAPGEVGDLATALHRMAEQLAMRLDALEADDQLMTAVLESLEEGVIALDERGMVIRINERARSLLGATTPLPFPRELLPRDPSLREAIEAALAGATTPSAEVTLHERTVAVASRPLGTGGGVVHDVFTAIQPAAAAKHLALVDSVSVDATHVRVDPTAFRQILTNLVENAVRYTREGSVTVRTRKGDAGVWVDVSDTGIGISSEHLPRIFERFYRVDAGRSRAEGGTGLGLAIVRHLVDAHGGRIDAASALGRGTTISVLLPDEQ
jgi:signal transduction histidine kinase